MQVNLVAITQPTQLLKSEGVETPQDLIAYCAKVSNPTNQLNMSTADKLLKYLVRNKHWSPFEMVTICLEIKTTRDIGRQILRHRSFSFQEFSQRYAKIANLTQPREIRWQDTKNRQNSIDLKTASEGDFQTAYTLRDDWYGRQQALIDTITDFYSWAIKNNVAKEIARVILPEGLTPTHMYMTGTLRSWIHYCDLRMGNGTQLEHQEIAKECWRIITQEIPGLASILDKEEQKQEGNTKECLPTTSQPSTKNLYINQDTPDGSGMKTEEKLGLKLLVDTLTSLPNTLSKITAIRYLLDCVQSWKKQFWVLK